MSAARALVESLLKARKLDATLTSAVQPAQAIRTGPTGLAWLDVQMAGGWPYGETSQIVGPVSSGRTAVLWASLAAATQRGELAALVDPGDHFDPATAAAMGVDLDRVLWARGAAADPASSRALDRAIKAFGLVLDGGGFGLVAIDLGEIPPRTLARLPFTTWRRLQRLVDGRDTVALLLATAPLSRSARGLTVQLSVAAATTPVWHGTSARARRLVALRLTPHILAARRMATGTVTSDE